MSEQYIMLVFANTVGVSVCIPACLPEAGLLGCLSVELFNFVAPRQCRTPVPTSFLKLLRERACRA